MKKLIGFMLMLMIAVFAFAACGTTESGTDKLKYDPMTIRDCLTDLLTQTYAGCVQT